MDVRAVVATVVSALGIQRLVLPLVSQSSSVMYPTTEAVIVVGSSIFFVHSAEFLWKRGRKALPGTRNNVQPGETTTASSAPAMAETVDGAYPQRASRPATLADLARLRADFQRSLAKRLNASQQPTNGEQQTPSPPQQISQPVIGAKGKKNHVDALLGVK